MKSGRTGVVLIGLLWIAYAATEQRHLEQDLAYTTPQGAAPSPLYLFSHGADPRHNTGIRQASEYIRNGIITGSCYTFSYNDSVTHINFGQEADCQRLAHAYDKLCSLNKQADIVLVGLSRGSVAILHFLAIHDSEKLARIKGVILESPFDTLNHVIEHIAQTYCGFLPGSSVIIKELVNQLPAYKPYGFQALDYARHIYSKAPFLISFSLEDTVVPADGTQTLVDALIENGNSVTTVTLEKGRHSKLSFQHTFQDAARTFLNQIAFKTKNLADE